MKNLTLVLVLSLTLTSVFAQNSTYEKEMKKNINLLHNARNADEYQKVANKFDLIANKETDKWLPFYYASFSRILMSYIEPDGDKKDAIEWYQRAFERADSVEALNNLAVIYDDGDGVDEDDYKAFRLYYKAARAGNKKAMENLAQMYENGEGTQQNSTKAKYWREKAAK